MSTKKRRQENRPLVSYRHVEQPSKVTVDGDNVKIEFDEPQRAATSGQSVVLYDGDTVLGGGIIKT